MDRLKKHADTVVVVSGLVGAVIWMTTSLHNVENRINDKITSLDKRLIAIETVMMTQGYNIKGIAASNIEKLEEKK